MEKKLDPNLEEEIYHSQQKIDLDQLEGQSLRSTYLFTDHFEVGAKIIDCQEEEQKRLWSVPDSLHIPFEQLCKSYQSLDKGNKYILYCTFGSKAPYIAEIMQQSGYEAYAFSGGVRKVKQAFSREN